MEREAFLSGYCRCNDASRTVAVEAEDNILTEVDCNYEACPHVKDCTIAQKIADFLKNE